ncbi:MAG: hypothetical protein LWX11_00870 [Firmicutes bacterium]|nr:hypothetical protein [Bacillota bacterium]
MVIGNWLALLERQSQGASTWDDVVVGYDFGFLKPEEIQHWVRASADEGEACERLRSLVDPGLQCFESCLWQAAAEATGRAPRPGSRRWAQAQDRWRVALLRDLLEAPLTLEALGVAVETLYERVGCPEDMLGLWSGSAPWSQGPTLAQRAAIEAFVHRLEGALAA